VIPPFVDADWLAAHHDEVIVADVRWYPDGRSGQKAYESGHLPGAVFVDLETSLAAHASDGGGRHPLPSPDAFAAAMAEAGIGDGDTVVAYDDEGGIFAARLIFMLRMTGHEGAVLDGGIGAWDGPLVADGGDPRVVASFTARRWPAERLAGIDQVSGEVQAVVVDARQRERYEGAPDPFDPRAGHIPGSRSLPCRENLGPGGRLLPVEELRERLTSVGIEKGTPVISYCGSGVTACHNLLVIELVGYGLGQLFPGSWSQWSRDPARPVALGPDPG
jgi:thiosulfate/3-mercaptopyruvate sulfurtransferase